MPQPRDVRAGDLISGKLKRLPSYHSELADRTIAELEAVQRIGGDAGRRAAQILKLIRQAERLRRKLRGT